MKFLILTSVLFSIESGLCDPPNAEEKYPTVVTPLGKIEGIYNTSSNGKLYESYMGIPFAEAITQERRFEVARPAKPWTGILSAKSFGPSCMQIDILSAVSSNPSVSGSEDCLLLNVFIPARESGNGEKVSTNLLPVILFIHGGGFQFGSAAIYGPKYLLNEQVVLVTINYRLGVMGFLSTEDDTIPGNMGLKDQVIAMRWVKDYIEYFGGDPENVSLFGQSAGAVSVQYHYLTDLTIGLFQRGLSISGHVLNCWSQTENSLDKAKKLASILGCPSSGVGEMIDCLRTKPGEKITMAIVKFTPWLDAPFTPFGPVVEKGTKNFTFIDREPVDILVSGDVQDVPWVYTAVKDEGLGPASSNATLLKDLNDNWDTIAPFLLEYNYTLSESEKTKYSQLIREHYLGKKSFDNSTVVQLIRMLGDRLFNSNSEKAVKLQALAMKKPVRVGFFSYRGAHSASEVFTGTKTNYGVSHLDDLGYVMNSYLDPTTTAEDLKMQKGLIDFWVSFATNGEPYVGTEWPQFDPTEKKFSYLHIAGPSNIFMDGDSNFGDKDFWNTIPLRENIRSE